MVLSNVIVDIISSSRSFVFSQSDAQIPAGLTNIIVQSFCVKKSVNLQLIATEGISMVLDLENYP